MYSRIEELDEYQKKTLVSDSELSQTIGIDILTLKKVRCGARIFPSTTKMLDRFLDNPVSNEVKIDELLKYKEDNNMKFEVLADEIGVSNKTLFNAIRRKPVSASTRKLINSFLSKKVVNV